MIDISTEFNKSDYVFIQNPFLGFWLEINNKRYVLQNAVYSANWGEMVRLRLRYDEAKKQVTTLQEQLAKIEDQMIPGQNESDKDR